MMDETLHDDSELINVAAAAEILGVSKPRIRQLIYDGTIKSGRLVGPKRLMMRKDEIEAMAKNPRPNGAPPDSVRDESYRGCTCPECGKAVRTARYSGLCYNCGNREERKARCANIPTIY